MYVVEVMPLGKGISSAGLSYFSKTPYERGTLLEIPLRKKTVQGVVISSQAVSTLKATLRGAGFLLRRLPPQKHIEQLPPALLHTADELSEYYAATTGAVLFALLPNEIKNGEKRILGASQDLASCFGSEANQKSRKVYGSCKEQCHTYEVLQAPTDARVIAYQRIVRTSFAEGKSVVLVVPTVADGEFLFSILGARIAYRASFLHSGLGIRALRLAYKQLTESTDARLIIATPQYAFFTRGDVGTVILERSRSFSYRSRSRPYLDFRHALAAHARRENRRLITADALVRTEDEYLVREDRAVLFEDHHQKRLDLPGALVVIPMKHEANGQLDFRLFSDRLLAEMEQVRARSGRAFLFSARRGIAPIVACVDCGTILRCPVSGSPLALHRVMAGGMEERWLISSVSGYRRKADDLCPQCGSWRLRPRGIGIQQVYDELIRHVPRDDVFLFDHQSASTHKKATALRDAFYAKKKTVLLGTALALPYLHKPVGLSAIVNMDALRAIPSWRQEEESLGILLALREKTHGSVCVQTRSDEGDLIRYAHDGTIAAYYTEELAAREKFQYPPYGIFIHLTWKKDAGDVLTKAIAERLEAFAPSLYGAPDAEDRIGYGLIRVPSAEWPQDALVDALRTLPPSVRIIINPDRII
ncbi:hypothetical protein A3H16_03025 [Candidatus Kaiserbacteria bacterium RIFCSPLOWO2_12_FULL_53_8]|uniref:Primosomal protein N' 3' DNA-binding domain-containing protein n=1 Tax=Candidatus Kaiserbacteria bacterium RIFCSPLOWO2_12_FULL_53_8 TaxID=1798529 RepID=A0A1F6FYX0_9BACT|nr:MAG: hypothetical protein A3H16_03025 [Candidatus Kaiserbacteria bacterium RIFCSPLOWO2_12_FULL_53_8]